LSLVDEFAFFVGRVRSTAGAWDEGEGAPVVLLHGIAGGRRSFFRLVPLLAKRRRVVVPLLRGEERPEPRATMDDLLDQLAGLLERLDLKGVTLLGTSFGGFLALAYTARHDPRVEAVVVQGAFASPRASDPPTSRGASCAAARPVRSASLRRDSRPWSSTGPRRHPSPAFGVARG
jgi:pimeloyl-ACP methyl ester carboxylesterase